MNKKYIPDFIWDEDIGLMSCYIEDQFGRHHIGLAQCHENDADMKSEKTGWEISHARAEINKLKSYIKDELKPRLRGLKQLYYSMNRSKKFNADSYENHMLQKQMKNIENEIEIVKLAIDDLQDDLNQYLDNKDNIYKSLRRNRKLKGDLNEQAKNI